MKKILGLDLGTNSIGWGLVNEAEDRAEKSSIIRLGVRVIHYDNFVSTVSGSESKEPEKDFRSGKGISPNAGRTLKRCARRNLQRYKLRREQLVELLKAHGFISDETILSENGNQTTFETYRLRAKAAVEEISLREFARVLLLINKKRGYKSSRKVKDKDNGGALIDGMDVAKKLHSENLTPGQYCHQLLEGDKNIPPDFYRSDLQSEFDRIWAKQKEFYPEILTDELKGSLQKKNEKQTWAICEKPFGIVGIKRSGKGNEQRKENFAWRAKALFEKIDLEYLAIVLQKINAQLGGSSDYLGNISDRSKELFFSGQTVGQYQMDVLGKNPSASLKKMIFYRQDYLNEFDRIWETQAKFHKKLTDELKHKIRNEIIFYQRRLKSQKGRISFCEFENHKKDLIIDGKKKTITAGLKVTPRSSPLFQEFKIWQILNNIEIMDKTTGEVTPLVQDEKEKLFAKLQTVESLTPKGALETLFGKQSKNYEIENYKEKIEGNRTAAKIHEALNGMPSESELTELWHLLYSWEGDNNKLAEKLSEKYGYPTDIAQKLSHITFLDDHGSLSAKAIKKILPHLKNGKKYDEACELVGYAFSKSSLTKEQIESKVLKNRLDILPKNALQNPVVEKIINQMIHVVNSIIDVYGKPDEIRVELARELKKSAKEREKMAKDIADITKSYEQYRETLTKPPFNLAHISRNDIIRYKLYNELKGNGYKTLYSNTYIPQEALFSGDFDVEHIIPQSRLFDDSFSNKTLELRSINIEKGNQTAYDFIKEKYGEDGLENYLHLINDLFKQGIISRAKYNKLKMQGPDIPEDFIERDIRETQYIAKYAKMLLEDIVKFVVATTGSVTERLREDWQLVDVMKELNWGKYDALGLTEIIEGSGGKRIRRIKDWTKRNDHRHHAMDALTVAFTKRSFIQYLNNLNARSNKGSEIYGIEQKELYRNDKGKLIFKPPFAMDEFRNDAKKHLENVLISTKAKNKVVTQNINATKKKDGKNKTAQQTPRGQLHKETIYGSQKQYAAKVETVNATFDEAKILTVTRPAYRDALLKRLRENGNDPKKAFGGKNAPAKNPIYLDDLHTKQVPEKVKTMSLETVYTVRKEISHELNIEKVVDKKIRAILEKRLADFNGNAKEAFSDIEKNPIWQNKEKGIAIKRVTISGPSNVESLHRKKDKDGNFILDKDGNKQPNDFVSTSNNHHVAIYRDEDGNLQEQVVSFFEAVERANNGLPIIDKTYMQNKSWTFLFTMKQNEYFVFPNEKTGFDPKTIDLMDADNYALISPNLFRVQTMSKVTYGNSIVRDYKFRHHLETSVKDIKELSGITYRQYKSLSFADTIVKVRINHIGQIISVGEY